MSGRRQRRPPSRTAVGSLPYHSSHRQQSHGASPHSPLTGSRPRRIGSPPRMPAPWSASPQSPWTPTKHQLVCHEVCKRCMWVSHAAGQARALGRAAGGGRCRACNGSVGAPCLQSQQVQAVVLEEASPAAVLEHGVASRGRLRRQVGDDGNGAVQAAAAAPAAAAMTDFGDRGSSLRTSALIFHTRSFIEHWSGSVCSSARRFICECACAAHAAFN